METWLDGLLKGWMDIGWLDVGMDGRLNRILSGLMDGLWLHGWTMND